MESENQPYRYDALVGDDTIRLLRLHPGRRSDPLSGELEHVSLHDGLQYEGVSYVWGDQDRCAEITCHGRRLALTRSIADALRRIRHETDERMVWADQISINQDDLEERGQQVMLMNSIYKRASQILVWLGRDDDGVAKDVFRLIRELSVLFKAMGDLDAIPTNVREKELWKFPKASWTRLMTFYNLPWVRLVPQWLSV
jgi:hypothetical protein